MNLLALDTSTEIATVALSVQGETHSLQQSNIRQHAQHLLPMIQALMQKAHLSWSQLDGIVFGSGPGSFTGLRISCSIAKALSYAHDRPIFAVNSLDAIAYQAKERWQDKENMPDILAMIDARMQELYWAYYTRDVFINSDICVGGPDTIPKSKKPFAIAGWGLEAYHEVLPQALETFVMTPEASTMIQLVQKGFITGISAAEALPLYVRNQITHVGEKKHG